MGSIWTSGLTDASLYISIDAYLSVLPLTSFRHVNSEFSFGSVQITGFALQLHVWARNSHLPLQLLRIAAMQPIRFHWFLPHSWETWPFPTLKTEQKTSMSPSAWKLLSTYATVADPIHSVFQIGKRDVLESTLFAKVEKCFVFAQELRELRVCREVFISWTFSCCFQ